MGKQIAFTEENVKKNPFDYPKLKLAKGESARLTIVESPFSEWVHSIQKPMLDESNNVMYKTQERRDGTEYQVPKLTFVSNPLCLGEDDALEADGSDPANCPICARAVAGGKGFFPKRRFAMHVIRTATRPGSNSPMEPFSGSLIIWAFTDNVFSNITAIGKEFGLKDHDLILGPCEDATFQKAKLNAAGGTAVDSATRAAIYDKKNQAEDPTVFCGTRKNKARILDDLAIVDAVWELAGGEDNSAPVTSAKSLNEGIGALLDELTDDEGWAKEAPKAEKVEKPAATPEPVTSFDDLPAKSEAPKAAAKAPAPEAGSIDDILDNL